MTINMEYKSLPDNCEHIALNQQFDVIFQYNDNTFAMFDSYVRSDIRSLWLKPFLFKLG